MKTRSQNVFSATKIPQPHTHIHTQRNIVALHTAVCSIYPHTRTERVEKLSKAARLSRPRAIFIAHTLALQRYTASYNNAPCRSFPHACTCSSSSGGKSKTLAVRRAITSSAGFSIPLYIHIALCCWPADSIHYRRRQPQIASLAARYFIQIGK